MAKTTAFLQAKASKASIVGGREIRSEKAAITHSFESHATTPNPAAAKSGMLHHHSLFYRNLVGVATNGLGSNPSLRRSSRPSKPHYKKRGL